MRFRVSWLFEDKQARIPSTVYIKMRQVWLWARKRRRRTELRKRRNGFAVNSFGGELVGRRTGQAANRQKTIAIWEIFKCKWPNTKGTVTVSILLLDYFTNPNDKRRYDIFVWPGQNTDGTSIRSIMAFDSLNMNRMCLLWRSMTLTWHNEYLSITDFFSIRVYYTYTYISI